MRWRLVALALCLTGVAQAQLSMPLFDGCSGHTITWTQPSDSAEVTAWEFGYSRTTTAPSDALYIESIARAAVTDLGGGDKSISCPDVMQFFPRSQGAGYLFVRGVSSGGASSWSGSFAVDWTPSTSTY